MKEEIGDRAKRLLREGKPAAALEAFEQIVDMLKRTKGVNPSERLTALSNLSVALYEEGRYTEARIIQKRVVSARATLFGEENNETLTAIGNLAWTNYRLGHLVEAERLFRKVVNVRKHVDGPSAAVTLSALDNLAWTIQVSGKRQTAARIQKSVLDTRRAVLGERHPETAASMSTLGATYYQLGRLAEARRLQTEALAIAEENAATDARFRLAVMGNLALTAYAQGDFIEAKSQQTQLLNVVIQNFGESHSETLAAKLNLVQTYGALALFENAYELQSEVLEITERAKTARDPIHLRALSELALTLQWLGDWPRAEELGAKALKLHQRALGRLHPNTLVVLVNLALTYYRRDDLVSARKQLERAVRQHKQVHGFLHVETLSTIGDLAVVVREEGDLQRSRRLQLQVLNARSRLLGENHPHTLYSKGELAELLQAMGKSSEAARLGEEVVRSRQKTLGPEHPDTLAAMVNLAMSLSTKTSTRSKSILLFLSLVDVITGPSAALSIVSGKVMANFARLASELARMQPSLEWRAPLAAVSRKWTEAIALAPPSQTGALSVDFVAMHSIWLGLCLRYAIQDVPIVLSALQGREMAANMLDLLVDRSVLSLQNDLYERYFLLVGELRSLRLQLSNVLEGQRVSRDKAKGRASRPANAIDASQLDRIMQERSLLTRYDCLYKEFKVIERKLGAIDPAFDLVSPRIEPDATSLADKLNTNEVLVLLFSFSPDAHEHHYAWCVDSEGRASFVELPRIGEILEACRQYDRLARRAGQRGTVRSSPDNVDGSRLSNKLTVILQDLQETLWAGLDEKFPEASTWFVATHQDLHNLPIVQARLPRGRDCSIRMFPGIAFFSHFRSSTQRDPTALAVHYDPAWSSLPIPMVEAETALIRSFVPDSFAFKGSAILGRLETGDPPLGAIAMLSHGELHAFGTLRDQAAIIIDADNEMSIDAISWMAFKARPSFAFLTSCVGGWTSDTLGGEPLGLVSALMMRGCSTVIASLSVLPDFYTPLLSGLFWYYFERAFTAGTSLRIAKERLTNGDWPPGFEQAVRIAYKPVMEEVLTKLGERFDAVGMRLLEVVSGWLLPEQIRDAYFRQNRTTIFLKFIAEHCRTEETRKALVSETLNRLVDERANLPRGEIDHICTWVQVFG